MRDLTTALVVCLAAFGCRSGGGGDTDPHGDHTTAVEFDEETLLAVAEAYSKYEDIGVLAAETTVDESGATVPRWEGAPVYAYNPTNLDGMGIHYIDITYPIQEYDEQVARIVMYDLSATGEYEIAGLEWYFETADGAALEEVPAVFGVPMHGIMEGHTPEQGMHYDLHGWLWKTSDQNTHGYFNEFNPGMKVPDWWLEAEDAVFASFRFFDPTVAGQEGYLGDGSCISGAEGDAGIPLVNEALLGGLDPFAPDTILTDAIGLMVAVQWTSPDDGTGPPTLFQQTFDGPDENGNYFLRFWLGRTNAGGLFAEVLPYPVCP